MTSLNMQARMQSGDDQGTQSPEFIDYIGPRAERVRRASHVEIAVWYGLCNIFLLKKSNFFLFCPDLFYPGRY
jgi:hypothetical protein